MKNKGRVGVGKLKCAGLGLEGMGYRVCVVIVVCVVVVVVYIAYLFTCILYCMSLIQHTVIPLLLFHPLYVRPTNFI